VLQITVLHARDTPCHQRTWSCRRTNQANTIFSESVCRHTGCPYKLRIPVLSVAWSPAAAGAIVDHSLRELVIPIPQSQEPDYHISNGAKTNSSNTLNSYLYTTSNVSERIARRDFYNIREHTAKAAKTIANFELVFDGRAWQHAEELGANCNNLKRVRDWKVSCQGWSLI